MSMAAQGSEESTTDLAPTAQERDELRLALRIYVTDLRTEISHTDRYEFREELTAKRAILEGVLRRGGVTSPTKQGPPGEAR